MSLAHKIGAALSIVAASSCAPKQHSEELSPDQYAVPLFFVPPEEAHPSCATETVQCNYYSDYGTVFGFKCRDAQNQPYLYISETNRLGHKLWYGRRLQQDINNQTFSEYCKSTFKNYARFMQDTGY